jgi:peptidyl-prolyl cis-trans isomerase C
MMTTRAMMTTPVMHRASATTKTTAVKALATTTTTRPTMLMKMIRRSMPNAKVTTTTMKTKTTNVATRAMPMDGIEHVERLVATTADAETVALTYGSIGLVVASIGYFVWKAFGSMLVGPSATASHVLVKSESEALKLKEEIESEVKAGAPLGAKFASVAEKHSTCPSAKKGGELGTFKPGQMVKEFDTVVFNGPLGQVLGPVNTQFGSHLILITSRDEK